MKKESAGAKRKERRRLTVSRCAFLVYTLLVVTSLNGSPGMGLVQAHRTDRVTLAGHCSTAVEAAQRSTAAVVAMERCLLLSCCTGVPTARDQSRTTGGCLSDHVLQMERSVQLLLPCTWRQQSQREADRRGLHQCY